jgi:hypothetical protein
VFCWFLSVRPLDYFDINHLFRRELSIGHSDTPYRIGSHERAFRRNSAKAKERLFFGRKKMDLFSEIHFLMLGAGNETRTRDPDLGKVVLYQLSYSRVLVRRIL